MAETAKRVKLVDDATIKEQLKRSLEKQFLEDEVNLRALIAAFEKSVDESDGRLRSVEFTELHRLSHSTTPIFIMYLRRSGFEYRRPSCARRSVFNPQPDGIVELVDDAVVDEDLCAELPETAAGPRLLAKIRKADEEWLAKERAMVERLNEAFVTELTTGTCNAYGIFHVQIPQDIVPFGDIVHSFIRENANDYFIHRVNGLTIEVKVKSYEDEVKAFRENVVAKLMSV